MTYNPTDNKARTLLGLYADPNTFAAIHEEPPEDHYDDDGLPIMAAGDDIEGAIDMEGDDAATEMCEPPSESDLILSLRAQITYYNDKNLQQLVPAIYNAIEIQKKHEQAPAPTYCDITIKEKTNHADMAVRDKKLHLLQRQRTGE